VTEPQDLQPVRVGIDNTTFRELEQGQRVTSIIHRGTAPGTVLSSYAIHLPPAHVGKAHAHRYSDVIVQVVHGWAATLWGPGMQILRHGPGQQVWIPAGLEYAAVNLLDDTDVLAYEFRTDPGDNVDVTLLPYLDGVALKRVEDLRAEHHRRREQARTAHGQPS
jgi:uncharacterized RmlC-like cupin family protein